MLRHERLIGIVSSWDIRRKDSEGYSLLVTDSRLVGAYRPEYSDDFWVYVQPGSEPSEEIRSKALGIAEKIISAKDFEMQKGNVIKIVLDEPDELFGGRLLIKSTGRQIELKITILSLLNREIVLTIDTLVNSLVAFAPELIYSEKTGARVLANRTPSRDSRAARSRLERSSWSRLSDVQPITQPDEDIDREDYRGDEETHRVVRVEGHEDADP